MSGLCGWLSNDPGALPIGHMAAPLTRFDHTAVRSAGNGAGKVALAVAADCGSLYHEDGLLIVLCGERVETLARLWRSHGVQACAAFAGSFSFAILDERQDQALLAVDRNASHPLFYQQAGRTLVFASSTEALARHPGVGREIDLQSIYNYLYFHAVPAPASIYKGQRRLMPGEYLHVHGGRLERGRYWKMQFHERRRAPDADLKEEFLGTFRSALQGTLGGQAGAVLLGGGLGSAAMTAMLGAASGKSVRTYSVGFDCPGDDTLLRARQLARHFGSTHSERCLGPADAIDAIPRLAAVFDQPLGDPSALAACCGAQMARADGVQRLFAGQGCAELFGGNRQYARQARFSQYERIPSVLRQALIEPLLFRLAGGLQGAALRSARDYIEQAVVPLPARLEEGNLLQGYAGEDVLEPEFLRAVDPTAPLAALSQSWWLAHGCSEVNQMIALDLKYALADLQLPKLMKACELVGIEPALPFLDDAVVAFSARLAPRQKQDGLRLSGFLRDALRYSLPRKALDGAECASILPFGNFLKTDARLRSLAFDSLTDLKSRRIVRAGFIDSLLGRRLAEQPGRHGNMVWLLMMLEQWYDQHEGGAQDRTLFARAAHETETCR